MENFRRGDLIISSVHDLDMYIFNEEFRLVVRLKPTVPAIVIGCVSEVIPEKIKRYLSKGTKVLHVVSPCGKTGYILTQSVTKLQ